MTALLLLPHDAPDADWRAARNKGITASRIAVVLGISPFDSPFNLYWKMRGDLPEQTDNNTLSLGRHLEPWIADRWAEEHADRYALGNGPAGLYANVDRPWQMCTPDRMIREFDKGLDPVSVLEVKHSGSYDGWGDDGTDEIPTYYRAQVLWQLDTLGLPRAHVSCLFLATRQIRNYVVDYDAADVELMRKRGLEFLEQVEAGEVPPIDAHHATTAALKQLHPDIDEDGEAEVPMDVAESYRWARAQLASAKEQAGQAENDLRAAMADAKRAVDPDGGKVATRSIYTVAEHVRKASTVDKLTPARPMKDAS